MKKKNILFLVSRFLDGGIDTVLVEVLRMLSEDERYRLTLAIGIRMEGLEVFHERLPENLRVEYLVGNSWLCAPKVRRFRKQSSQVEKVADELLLNPLRRMIQGRTLRRLVAEHDVVVDFDACHTAFLRGCPKPTVAWMHFSLQKMLEQNVRRTKRIVGRLRAYDRIVLICKAMQQEADRLFPELEGKTTFIYNSIDVEALRLRAAEETAFPYPYILAVERLEESQKDIRTLLKAYSQLGREEHLVVIGKGRGADALKEYARSIGLAVVDDLGQPSSADNGTGTVHFLGFRSNPHSWMKGAKMLAHSAKFEGLPTVLIEALLLDVPVVATDCPTGPSEILDEGRAGMLVPVGDADALATAMRRLLTDEALRSDILAHAAEHKKCFTKEMVKPQLDDFFASL